MHDAVLDMIAGTAGGFAQVAAGHPFDTVKTLLQTGDRSGSMVGVMRELVAKEGVRGLYRGAASPLAGAMAHNAGVFFSYGAARRLVSGGEDTSRMPLWKYFTAGAIAATAISAIEGPVDLFKVKAMSKEFPSSFSAATGMWKLKGIRGWYQGMDAVLLRNIPCFGLYFTFYEGTQRMLWNRDKGPTPLPVIVAAGGAAGFGFWGLLYPLETIKTVMQADNTIHRKFPTALAAIKSLYQQGGWARMYRGYTPSLVRAVVINSCIFTAVYVTKQHIKNNF